MGLRITFVACLVLLASHAYCAPFVTVSVLDNFTAVQSPVFVIVDGSAFPQSSSSAVVNANILGGERNLGVSVAASAAGRVFSAGVSNGALDFASATGATAEALLQYDGHDGSLQFDGPTSNGLDNFDATFAGAASGIRMVIATDIPTTVTVTIYDAAGRVSDLTEAVTELSLESVYFQYGQFVGSADLSDVGAIEVLMSGEGIDIAVDSIDFVKVGTASHGSDVVGATGSPVPSPASNAVPAATASPAPSPGQSDREDSASNRGSNSRSSRGNSSNDSSDDEDVSSVSTAVVAPVALVLALACLVLA